MQKMYYELSVLAKAIHFKNLSAAASHVGLSQPQLSRIIHKLEEDMKVVLLDRSAKRKSGWTPIAFKISEVFEKSSIRLETEISHLTNDQSRTEIHIGALEGMLDYALSVSNTCFNKIGMKKIFIDIYDFSDLEANFLSGNLDLIFTFKTPGKQKFKHLLEIGFQQLEYVNSSEKTQVLSSFEYRKMTKDQFKSPQTLVSNSLQVRKQWLEKFGGSGNLPTEIKKGKNKTAEPVILIGSEVIGPQIWEEIISEI